MARPLRIEYQGAFYHVTSRGNERKKIFLSKEDYTKFLTYVADAAMKYGVVLHAYALMGNHYHLLVETPLANLSSFMHTVNGGYTTYFNRKRKHAGHLFQGRYKAIIIEKDSYLLELSRYIHLNPVRAGVVEKPEDYLYTSYLAYILPQGEALISRDLIWGMISKNIQAAPKRYRGFVEAALTSEPQYPLEKVYGGMILGKKAFIRKVLQRTADEDLQKKDISHRRSLTSLSSSIDEIVNMLSRHFNISSKEITGLSPYRALAIYLARKHTTVPNAEIGRLFNNISYSAVTKTGTRFKQKLEQDGRLRDEVAKIEKKLLRRATR